MFEKVTLEGDIVILEPLNEIHKCALADAVRDGQLWCLNTTLVPSPDNIEEFLMEANQQFRAFDGIAFAIVEKKTGVIIGSTRFMKFHSAYRRIEIGYTFLSKSKQKMGFNVEAKYLMLTYAFEKLHLNRVEFVTDYLNSASRNALIHLGAKEEGLLRCHMVMPNGRIRDSAIYSIVNHDWAAIKENLNSMLMRHGI